MNTKIIACILSIIFIINSIAFADDTETSSQDNSTPSQTIRDEAQILENFLNDPENTFPQLLDSPENGEYILPLEQGTPVPEDGVFLNQESAAWLSSELETLQEEAQLFLRQRLRLLSTDYERRIAQLELQVQTQDEEHRIALQTRDREIAGLQNINRISARRYRLKIMGFTVGGVSIGALIGYILVKVL